MSLQDAFCPGAAFNPSGDQIQRKVKVKLQTKEGPDSGWERMTPDKGTGTSRLVCLKILNSRVSGRGLSCRSVPLRPVKNRPPPGKTLTFWPLAPSWALSRQMTWV